MRQSGFSTPAQGQICSVSQCSMACVGQTRGSMDGACARPGAPICGRRRPAGRSDLPARRLPSSRHDPGLYRGRTVKRWKVCKRPNDTAIQPRKAAQLSVQLDPGLAVLCYRIWALTFLGLLEAGGASSPSRCGPSSQVMDMPTPSHFVTCSLWYGPNFWSGDFEACERHSAELVAYCT